jgi:pyruvate formate lyase activating enzyme
MHCPFCQNYTISQSTQAQTRTILPENAVELARQSGAPSIAFTYSEPSIHWEYLYDCARAAKANGLRTVLVTNGNILREPATTLLEYIDAVNLDIKAWSVDVYMKCLGGSLETVKDFARFALERSHLEITTLVVPGISSSQKDIQGIAGFIAGLSPDIPLHLSMYRPMFRYTQPSPAPETMRELRLLAQSKLRFVYLGNMAGEPDDTRCTNCGTALIRREGYSVKVLAEATCPRCASPVPYRTQ